MASVIAFYRDEHVHSAVTAALRRRDNDVVTPQEMGTMEDEDEKHFVRAQTMHRVIFSQDRDFLRLARINPNHHGLVYISQHTESRHMIRSLIRVHAQFTPASMIGHVEFI